MGFFRRKPSAKQSATGTPEPMAANPSRPMINADLNAVETTPSAAPDMSGQPTGQPRSRAVRTRLIGFESSDGRLDLLKDEPTKSDTAPIFEPVGWMVVVDGPGRGNAFTLRMGLSTIGRDADQTVTLDFGDLAISRSNHVAIAFETETGKFLVGHGGKANIVRLNGKPLMSTEEMQTGDQLVIGETTLQLVTLCGPDLNWAKEDTNDGEDDANVAFI